MAATQIVRARIDETVKAEATAVLARMGLSASDVIRMLFIRLAAEKALPFSVYAPNPATLEAIDEIGRGGMAKFASVDALFADLDEA